MPKLCPLVGDPCLKHDCEFYDVVPGSKNRENLEYDCRFALTNRMLNDTANVINHLLNSNEDHRTTFTELIKMNITGQPSQKLLEKAGLKEIEPPDEGNPQG